MMQIDTESAPTKTLYLSLPDDTYDRIKAKALAEQMSVTAWIRRALGDKPRRRYQVKASKADTQNDAQ
jgi:Ribbon-helix-helix protein, copG family